MRFSFVIPVYNCEGTVQACVESILRQELEEPEILLINDGSTDRSGAVCDALAEKNAGVRVIHQSNGGVSAARNRGIREAKGEYLFFVDADDVLLPFHPEVWETLREEKPDILVFGMLFRYLKGDRIVREENMVCSRKETLGLREITERFSELFLWNCFSSSCNKAFRRCLLIQNDLAYDSGLTVYEDLAFSLQCMARCENVCIMPHIGYLYRIPANAAHIQKRVARMDDVLKKTDRIADAFRGMEEFAVSDDAVAQIRRALFDVYMVQFRAKLQTASMLQIEQGCRAFRENANIRSCMPYVLGTNKPGDPVVNWIEHNSVRKIWLYIRYRKARNSIVTAIRWLLRK